MNKIFRQSPMNPLRFIKEGPKPAGMPVYGTVSFVDSLTRRDAKAVYLYPMKRNDIVVIEVAVSTDITAMLLDIYTDTFVKELYPTGQTALAGDVYNGQQMVTQQYIFTPDDIAELDNLDYFLLKVRTVWNDDSTDYHTSEPIFLRKDHPETSLIEFNNPVNDFDTLFEQFPYPRRMRVPSIGNKLKMGGESTLFENQVGENVLLSDTLYRSFAFEFGGKSGIPDWVVDKLCNAFRCQYLSIDGKLYTKEDGQQLEPALDEGRLDSYTIVLREAKHESSYITSETSFLLWERPSFPYAITGASVDTGLAQLGTGTVDFYDEADEDALVTSLNAQRITYAMRGEFVNDGGSIYYNAAPGETILVHEPIIMSDHMTMEATVQEAVSIVGVNFTFDFIGGAVIFSPGLADPSDPGDGRLAPLYRPAGAATVNFRYRFNQSGEVARTVHIFHNNLVRNFGCTPGSNINPGANLPFKVNEVTGDCPTALLTFDMFNHNMPSFDFNFFDVAQGIRVIRLERCGLTTIPAGWAGNTSGGLPSTKPYPLLYKLVLSFNNFNSTAVDNILIDYALGTNFPPVSEVYLKTIAGTNPPTSASLAARQRLATALATVVTD